MSSAETTHQWHLHETLHRPLLNARSCGLVQTSHVHESSLERECECRLRLGQSASCAAIIYRVPVCMLPCKSTVRILARRPDQCRRSGLRCFATKLLHRCLPDSHDLFKYCLLTLRGYVVQLHIDNELLDQLRFLQKHSASP